MIVTENSLEAIIRLKSCLPTGEDMRLFQLSAPVFYKFSSKMSMDDIPLLAPIIDALLSPFEYLRSFTTPHDTGLPMCNENLDGDSLECFPRLPKQQQRGIYDMDGTKSREETSVCEKRFSRHDKLSPGIFTLFCEHGESNHRLLLFSLTTWHDQHLIE